MTERKKTFLERLTGTSPADDRRADQSLGHASTEESSDEDHDAEDNTAVMYTSSNEETIESDPDEDEEQEAGLAIDMYETDNELIIQSMIAGVAPENLHISITRDLVTITGKRIAPGVPQDNYITQELYWGLFSRAIALPFEIDTDGAEAVEKYGLLIIRLPKIDSNKVQELKVKAI